MKKKIIFGLGILAIALLSVNVSIEKKDNGVHLSLKSIGKVAQAEAEYLTPINYNPYYYTITQSWCCFTGTSGCVPYNCNY